MKLESKNVRGYLQKNNLVDSPGDVFIEEIGRGAFNVNYLITAGNRKFVFRFVVTSMRDNIVNMADYETKVLGNLEELGISPKVFFCDESRKSFYYSLIVEEFIEGKTMLQSNANVVDQIIDCLPMVVNFHKKGKTQGLVSQSEIVSSEFIDRRKEHFKKHGSSLAVTLEKNKLLVNEYIQKCNLVLSSKEFVHGDMHPENFIYSKDKKWKLVDWQSAYLGDPALDIANLLWDFGWKLFTGRILKQDQKKKIIYRYCKLSGQDSKKIHEKINLATIWLDFDMLLRIEYFYTFYEYPEKELEILDEDIDFILNKRVIPARNVMASKKGLKNIFKRMKEAV